MRPLSPDTTASLSSTPRILLSPEDQKLVDSAKDILMHQRDLSEEQAYSLLSEMAEKRKTGMVDMSLQLINITKRLTV
jgi:AmiR/NasT family two-component response regulator